MQRAKSEYAIQTVTNALRVLEAFETDEQLGVTDLARRLDLHKNNVFRLLATLEEKRWVEQTDAELYRLGAKCLRLSQAYTRTRLLTRHARASLVALSRETGETVHLAVLNGFEVVHLDGEQSPGMIAGTLRVGDRLPSYCTALGKVLIACGARSTLEDYDRVVVSNGIACPHAGHDRRSGQADRAPAPGRGPGLRARRRGIRARSLVRRRPDQRRQRTPRGRLLRFGSLVETGSRGTREPHRAPALARRRRALAHARRGGRRSPRRAVGARQAARL